MRHLTAVVIFSVLAARNAWAVGETTGRVRGVAVEASTQIVVAGAHVSATSLARGTISETVTDEHGVYEIENLLPGEYDVSLTLEGTLPLHRRVVVSQGTTSALSFAWSAESVASEVTDVHVQRPLTNPDSTQTGTVLDEQQENRIATARRYQTIALQAGGTVDVTGNGNPQIKGGLPANNRYLVDGLDITDPQFNGYSANINFDSIDQEQILTGGMEAQYNALGGVINLLTKTGSDKLSIDSSFYASPSAFAANSSFGNQLYLGQSPFNSTPLPSNQRYQGNLNVGGAFIPQKWWFHSSLQYTYTQTATPAAPPLNLAGAPLTQHSLLARFKTTYQPNDSHRLTLSVSADPTATNNVTQDNARLPVAENRLNQGGVFAIGQWEAFWTSHVSTQLQTGFQYLRVVSGPEGILADAFGRVGKVANSDSAIANTYDRHQASHTNLDDGTVWYNGGTFNDSRRFSEQFDPSLSIRGNALGTHDAMFGLQLRSTNVINSISAPGGSIYADRGGGPGEAGLCNTATGRGCFQRVDFGSVTKNALGYSAGAFAQDRWHPFPRWTILPGIRLDFGQVFNTHRELVSSLFGVGPRIGTTFDLTGDQKTIASVFYGRSNEVGSLLPAFPADITPERRINLWNPVTKTFDFAFQRGGAGGYVRDPSGTPPHADEITLSVRRELWLSTLVSIDYTFKHLANIWQAQEINQIWDPTGRRVVGYANGTAAQVLKVTDRNDSWRTYHGIDLTLEGKPTPNWDLGIVYTLSWQFGNTLDSIGNLNAPADTPYYNPRFTPLFVGFLREDTRHNLRIRASYNWMGLTLGGFLNFHTGAPVWRTYFNGNDGDYTTRRTPQGTAYGTPNTASSISELRLPDLMQLDLRVQYDFSAILKQHVILIADVFNAFNLGSVTAFETRDLLTVGQVRSRQAPLSVQLGLRYTY